MSASTPIEWTDKSWNPTRGCRRVSPGCQHCYAERVAYRFSRPGYGYEGLVKMGKGGPVWTGEGRFIPDALDEPLKWRKPQMVFVNSMSDLFYEEFTNEEIAAVFGVMAASPRHTFQVLTKRPARAAEWFKWVASGGHPHDACLNMAAASQNRALGALARYIQALPSTRRAPHLTWPLPNVWLVASVENQATADERIPHLLRCPAAVRGVSYEPALEAVDFSRWLDRWVCPKCNWTGCEGDGFLGDKWCPGCAGANPAPAGLDWIIAGGESGPGARPCDVGWLRAAVAQARAAGVPVFVKQMGAVPYDSNVNGGDYDEGALFCDAPLGVTGAAAMGLRLRDKKGGDPAEWPADLLVREFPQAVSHG